MNQTPVESSFAGEQSAGHEGNMPDTMISVRETFGLDVDLQVPAYSTRGEQVPDLDPDYIFDLRTTMAILSGFVHDWRVLVSGYHGTGKSTHIEQVAARLNWPCVRINLDSHVSRCLLYTSPSPRDRQKSRMPSSA